MRMYVIPLLCSKLEQVDREIKLYKYKADYDAIDKSESKKYFEEQRDKWQQIREEILEAINKLEAI